MSILKLANILLVVISLNCILSIVPSMQKAIEQDNTNAKTLQLHTVKRSSVIDEMNICIDACSECLSQDLLAEEDSEDSPVLMCANECVLHNNPRKVMIQLLRRSVFDKEFAVCFMNLTFKN